MITSMTPCSEAAERREICCETAENEDARDGGVVSHTCTHGNNVHLYEIAAGR